MNTHSEHVDEVLDRISTIFIREFGRVEEDLVASGIVDSLKSIEVALILEEEFQVPLESLTMADMTTLESLSQKIFSVMQTLDLQGTI